MKEPRLVQDYLSDILDAMDKAEDFTDSLTLQAFKNDDKPFMLSFGAWKLLAKQLKRYPLI